jgi:uncharacterized protein (TIGR02145 family)
MKNNFIFLLTCLLLGTGVTYAQVSLGTNTPHSSALLDVTSTTQGFLPPRMTTTQRNAINSPAAGLTIYNTTLKCLETFDGVRWYNFQIKPEIMVETDVYSIATGKIWMDRNLGATQVATSIDDAAAYGDLYQWGRLTDGHQIRTSGTTSTTSSTDVPGNSNFIIQNNDWRSTPNTNLWQGVNGTNNPCPSGYRVPTEVEFEAERVSWTSQNSAGAFASPLKLTLGGNRNPNDGNTFMLGEIGYYWTSTIVNISSKVLISYSSEAAFINLNRSVGLSVRCIKN